MIKNVVLASIAAVGLAGPCLASAVLYECDIADYERAKGWISSKIAIILPGDNSVKIVDAITLSFANEPVSGTVLRDNAKRLIVKWTVEGVKTDDGTSFAGVNYRASIAKTTGAVEVSTIPNGYDTDLRANGDCKTRRK